MSLDACIPSVCWWVWSEQVCGIFTIWTLLGPANSCQTKIYPLRVRWTRKFCSMVNVSNVVKTQILRFLWTCVFHLIGLKPLFIVKMQLIGTISYILFHNNQVNFTVITFANITLSISVNQVTARFIVHVSTLKFSQSLVFYITFSLFHKSLNIRYRSEMWLALVVLSQREAAWPSWPLRKGSHKRGQPPSIHSIESKSKTQATWNVHVGILSLTCQDCFMLCESLGNWNKSELTWGMCGFIICFGLMFMFLSLWQENPQCMCVTIAMILVIWEGGGRSHET